MTLVAAHRATPEGNYAENTLESIQALYEAGILVAEIDIARLKDGTHILFHDGIWDDDTTGKGIVASSTYEDSQKVLMKDRQGDLTTSRPPRLTDVLDWSKDRVFLELDFKSSADVDYVISEVIARDMMDQVVFIAYNDDQAADMARLAPEPIMSLTAYDLGKARTHQKDVYGEVLIWTGYKGVDAGLVRGLNDMGLYAIHGTFGDQDRAIQNGRLTYSKIAETGLSLLVTDYPFKAQKDLAPSNEELADIIACLNN